MAGTIKLSIFSVVLLLENITAVSAFCLLFSELKIKKAPYSMVNKKVIVKVATELVCPLYWSNFIQDSRFSGFLQAYNMQWVVKIKGQISFGNLL